MALIIDGILTGKLPWGLVLLGRLHRRRHAAGRRPGAGLRGGRLPAAVDLGADLRRRPGPRGRRPGQADAARGVRLQPRRAALPAATSPAGRSRASSSPCSTSSRASSGRLDLSKAPARLRGTRAPGRRSPPSASPSLVLGLVGTGHLLRRRGRARRRREGDHRPRGGPLNHAPEPHPDARSQHQGDRRMKTFTEGSSSPPSSPPWPREVSCTPTRACGSSTTCR